MQVMRQKIIAVRLSPQLEGGLGDIVIGKAAVQVVQTPQTGNVGHGFDIEHQHGIQNNSFKNKYLYIQARGKIPVDR